MASTDIPATELAYGDPEVGVPDLVRRLTDDSRRLVGDEVRLAKLEMREAVRTGAQGGMWLGMAFGAAVVALTALTILSAALLTRLFGSLWLGTLVTGVVELAIGALLLKHGLTLYRTPRTTLPETRAELSETARWARSPVQSR